MVIYWLFNGIIVAISLSFNGIITMMSLQFNGFIMIEIVIIVRML